MIVFSRLFVIAELTTAKILGFDFWLHCIKTFKLQNDNS